MNRKSKWQEHINVYTNFLTPYNFSCYLLMLSKSHYLIALSYTLDTAVVLDIPISKEGKMKNCHVVRGIAKNQFTEFMNAICFNLKRLMVLTT